MNNEQCVAIIAAILVSRNGQNIEKINTNIDIARAILDKVYAERNRLNQEGQSA